MESTRQHRSAAAPGDVESPRLSSRSRILNAAALLFHRQGIAATAVDQILSESSTGKGQFYHYFAGKNALVEAVADQHGQNQIDALQAQLISSPGVEGVKEWLTVTLETSVSDGLTGGCPIASMAAEAGETHPILREKLALAFDAQLALLAEALEQDRLSGALQEWTDPDVLAMRILTSLQGGLLLAATMKEPALLEEAVQAAHRELLAASADKP